MDMMYPNFCLADPVFYDAPSRVGADVSDLGGSLMTGRTVPDGWVSDQTEGWTYLTPESANLPAQGWKVHLSATLDNAVAVLDAAWEYCVPRLIAFKFLPDRVTLLVRNGKYADRGASGKFVTIYPTATDELQLLLTELGAELDGQPGPYILNDLRWNAGPLHLRYGGYLPRFCRTAGGERCRRSLTRTATWCRTSAVRTSRCHGGPPSRTSSPNR